VLINHKTDNIERSRRQSKKRKEKMGKKSPTVVMSPGNSSRILDDVYLIPYQCITKDTENLTRLVKQSIY